MAKRYKRKTSRQKLFSQKTLKRLPAWAVGILAVIGLAFGICDYYGVLSYESVSSFLGITEKKATDADLSVHYIDVGQGDSILIMGKDKNVLIDAGEAEYGSKVVSYLKSQNISKIDYVISTHPHSDHIGGLAEVINAFDVGEVIMPKLRNDVVPTTKTYLNLLTTIQSKGLSITPAKAGDMINLGNAEMEIIAPVKNNYDNLNNYSVVTRLVHGKNTFLFAGDIESTAEKDILKSGNTVSAKVLKVPHHASSSSSTANFLKAVDSKYFVIQVGADNSYNHPNKNTLNRLSAYSKDIYRTDLNGTVIIESDGKGLNFIKEKS